MQVHLFWLRSRERIGEESLNSSMEYGARIPPAMQANWMVSHNMLPDDCCLVVFFV